MVRTTMQRRIFIHDRRAERRKQLLRDVVVGAIVVTLVQLVVPMIPAVRSMVETPRAVALALVTPDNPYAGQ
ncbi:MAG: hypothetical protein IT563_26895 [Alphaproteobacteria bacterium]|nr:hypothetical protein [Alphaproteobacteria bacterium]